MGMITWFASNWVAIVAIFTGGYVVVRDFVMLTPTKADDEILAKVEGALSTLGWRPPAK